MLLDPHANATASSTSWARISCSRWRCRPESLSPAQVSSLRYYHGVSLARPRRLCSSDARRRRTLATISSPGAPRASGRR